MIIPLLERAIQTTPSAPATQAGHDSKPIIAGWSSLIGIVVAIVGNIFISFALNIQRYAHVRLEKEQQDEENGYHNDQGPMEDRMITTLLCKATSLIREQRQTGRVHDCVKETTTATMMDLETKPILLYRHSIARTRMTLHLRRERMKSRQKT